MVPFGSEKLVRRSTMRTNRGVLPTIPPQLNIDVSGFTRGLPDINSVGIFVREFTSRLKI